MSFVLAYFFAFTDLYKDRLIGANRDITIIILLIYAVYRSYRFVKDILNRRKNEEN